MDKQNNANNDIKKNRISFKQFQQCYQQHIVTQKQKKKIHQQSLKRLSVNNVKPLQNNSKQKVNIDLKNKQSLTVSNSKKSFQSLTLTQLNSLNNSIATFPSCFVSPKSSTQTFIKSINLASNKSKQITNLQNTKQKSIDQKVNKLSKQSKTKNTMINLNCWQNTQKQSSKIINLKYQQIDSLKSKQIMIKKNSSLSKMTRADICQSSSLISFPSQKLLNYPFQKYINYLVNELNFINQIFKQMNMQQQKSGYNINSQFVYKLKLLNQIRNKLNKQRQQFVQRSNKQQDSLIKNLHSNILSLIQNYEIDLKYKLSSIPIQQKSKSKHLQIKLSDQIQLLDYQNRFKRDESKKKTVKLSKSRKTYQQTLISQSIVVNPFQTSQFSLLNTSKITDISRPSNQNKQINKSNYFNQIQHIINNKIAQNYQHKSYQQQQIPKYQSHTKLKIHLRGNSKSNIASIQNQNISNPKILNQQISQKTQSFNENKKKLAAKNISLIGNNLSSSLDKKPNHNDKYPNVPKCTKVVSKSIKQKLNSQNINPNIPKNIHMKNIAQRSIQEKQSLKDFYNISQHFSNESIRPLNESPLHTYPSHNDSIYELEYLENYSGFRNSIGSKIQNQFLPTSHQYQPTNNSISQQKYSTQLFR